MTKTDLLLPLSMAGAMLVLHTPALAQTADAPPPASLERIRAALDEPPPIWRVPVAPGDMPTFRVEVHQPFIDLTPVDEQPFDLTYGLPSVGELLMGGVGKIGSAAAGYKQRRTKRRARKEVQDALQAFCAVRECPATGSRK